jgi:Zn-dependent peptidase ImmA (M78 family)
LIEYIPSIRWHTTDVRNGLYQVIRELYTYGVTVIYEPYLTTIYVRGATVPVNDKPCIILTNYSPYYASFWFALMHELSHVLFDWDEIKLNQPHFSGEIDKFDKQEVEADEFAREYLFSKDKLKAISGQIGNETFIKRFANAYDIHPSIIYNFYCWDNVDSEDVYKRFSRHLTKFNEALVAYDPELMFKDANSKSAVSKPTPILEKSKQLTQTTFNGL